MDYEIWREEVDHIMKTGRISWENETWKIKA